MIPAIDSRRLETIYRAYPMLRPGAVDDTTLQRCPDCRRLVADVGNAYCAADWIAQVHRADLELP